MPVQLTLSHTRNMSQNSFSLYNQSDIMFAFCCCAVPGDTQSDNKPLSIVPTVSPIPSPAMEPNASPVSIDLDNNTRNSSTHLYADNTDDDTSSNSTAFIIDDRFEVVKQIGKGSFGTVWHGRDTERRCPVAVKILKHKRHRTYFRETECLKQLGYVDGIPQLFWVGRYEDRDVLILQRLGHDLSMLFEFCGHRFSIGTTLKIGIEMVSLIRRLHQKGFLHRDVKPHNFLVGYKAEKRRIFIIDFGLARTYWDSPRNKRHKAPQTGLMPVGTARYASLWTHQGVSQSRRDDLEGIGFVLIYFLLARLPWQGLTLYSKHEKWSRIYSVKANTSLKTLCKGIPRQFQEYLEYVRRLKFNQTPNYQFLIDLFKKAGTENGIDFNKSMEWDWEMERSITPFSKPPMSSSSSKQVVKS